MMAAEMDYNAWGFGISLPPFCYVFKVDQGENNLRGGFKMRALLVFLKDLASMW